MTYIFEKEKQPPHTRPAVSRRAAADDTVRPVPAHVELQLAW